MISRPDPAIRNTKVTSSPALHGEEPVEPTPAAANPAPTPLEKTRSYSRDGLSRIQTHTSHLDDVSVYHGTHEYDDEDEDDVDGDHTGESTSDASSTITTGPASRAATHPTGDPPRDLEAGDARLEKARSRAAAAAAEKKDPNLVTFSGPSDPENPKNWTRRQKWLATTVVSSFTFLSPLSSSMVAPALPQIAADLRIEPAGGIEAQMVLSVFIAAYMVGPLFLGPLSEIFGRVRVLQLSNLFYLVFNAACGAATNKQEMIAFRFLSGLGGSAPLAIGGGVLGDAWRADERGAAISVYSLMPLLGPAVGPIVGGFVTAHTTWRWTFYAMSMAAVVVQISGMFFLRETYPPRLLQLKAARLRKSTGNDKLYTVYDRHRPDGTGDGRTFASILGTALVRPFRLLFTQPIIQVLALYMAFLYGTMYLVLSTFASLWTERYALPVEIAGLHYIALGIGFFLGAQICAPLNDRIYLALCRRRGTSAAAASNNNNNDANAAPPASATAKKGSPQQHPVGRPEFRVPLMFGASFLVPAGIFLYGWTAEYRLAWILPDLGAALFAAGTIVCFQCIQTYLVDAYTRYAASAIAATSAVRSLCGFAFPLFAPYMYAGLGLGWGNSVLGFAALAVGVPAPVLLWVWGRRLRERSPFAAGGGGAGD